jgi:citrate lyase gamma subunit
VSAQENAKLSDRSMSAHFIKMTVNGRFSLIITLRKNVLTQFGGGITSSIHTVVEKLEMTVGLVQKDILLIIKITWAPF